MDPKSSNVGVFVNVEFFPVEDRWEGQREEEIEREWIGHQYAANISISASLLVSVVLSGSEVSIKQAPSQCAACTPSIGIAAF